MSSPSTEIALEGAFGFEPAAVAPLTLPVGPGAPDVAVVADVVVVVNAVGAVAVAVMVAVVVGAEAGC